MTDHPFRAFGHDPCKPGRHLSALKTGRAGLCRRDMAAMTSGTALGRLWSLE
jgi:hypothetical protein